MSVVTIIILVVVIAVVLFFLNNVSSKEEETQVNENGSNNVGEQGKVVNDRIPSEVTPIDIDKDLDDQPNSQTPVDNKDKDDAKDNNNSEQKENRVEKEDDNGYIVGLSLPLEPTYIDGILITNKKYPLPKSFSPGESVEARVAFEDMATAASEAGFELTAFSTYRSFEYQTTLYSRYVERDGKDNADRYSARPGYSEHQTGLAFDIGEVNREDLWLTSEFGESEAGKWLVENAHEYGFILRYPKGKELITGYMYESWHFRYLGIPVATEVYESGVTLEEYLGIN